MILDATIGIAESIGKLGPTALLGLIIVGLVFDRKYLIERMQKVQDENKELQDAAVERAERVTEKLVTALAAAERQFERNAASVDQMNRLLEQVLSKLDKR
jgi:uncharacterized membrane protein YcjF (UPF0283 family)